MARRGKEESYFINGKQGIRLQSIRLLQVDITKQRRTLKTYLQLPFIEFMDNSDVYIEFKPQPGGVELQIREITRN